jgi:hypothetical protein
MAIKKNRLTGVNPLAYLGVEPVAPPNVNQVTQAPTQNDYANFNISDLWLYNNKQLVPPNNVTVYMLVDKQAGIATWIPFAGGTVSVQSLTGNTGGPVGPLNSNINVVGDGTTINIAGNPGTHTLTASTTGAVAVNYVEDVGNAIPAGGVLNILGGNNIGTTGAGNTVTINVDGTTDHALQVGNAGGSLTSLAVATNGQLPIGSTGVNPVIANLTAGAGININNGPGSITISSLGPSVYEEGVWTPVLDFGSLSVGITYLYRNGYYVRIGNFVWVVMSMELTSKGSSVGDANISGFPYARNATPQIFFDLGIQVGDDITLDANFVTAWGSMTIGLASAVLTEGKVDGTIFQRLNDTNFGNNAAFTMQGFYII